VETPSEAAVSVMKNTFQHFPLIGIFLRQFLLLLGLTVTHKVSVEMELTGISLFGENPSILT